MEGVTDYLARLQGGMVGVFEAGQQRVKVDGGGRFVFAAGRMLLVLRRGAKGVG